MPQQCSVQFMMAVKNHPLPGNKGHRRRRRGDIIQVHQDKTVYEVPGVPVTRLHTEMQSGFPKMGMVRMTHIPDGIDLDAFTGRVLASSGEFYIRNLTAEELLEDPRDPITQLPTTTIRVDDPRRRCGFRFNIQGLPAPKRAELNTTGETTVRWSVGRPLVRRKVPGARNRPDLDTDVEA